MWSSPETPRDSYITVGDYSQPEGEQVRTGNHVESAADRPVTSARGVTARFQLFVREERRNVETEGWRTRMPFVISKSRDLSFFFFQ